jgi:ketoreductase
MPWGITVNAVCPGWVRTDMGQQSMAAIAEHYDLPPAVFEEEELRAVPLGRWIEPEEVAEMVGYLISPQAAAVTGQAFEISGGL